MNLKGKKIMWNIFKLLGIIIFNLIFITNLVYSYPSKGTLDLENNKNINKELLLVNNNEKMNNIVEEDTIESLVKFAKDNGIEKLPISFEEILKFSGGRYDLAKSLILATKEAKGDKSINELVKIYNLPQNPSPGSLSLYETRIWYKWQESLMGNKLDYKKPLEEVAKDAFEMRNNIRTRAREAMRDKEWSKFLMENEKNITFEQLVKRNMDKGLSGDVLWKKIIQSSMTSRNSIDSLFKLN